MSDEVFHASNGEPANFNTGNVNLSINGSSKGSRVVGAMTVGQFIDSQARSAGIRTFSVYADGAKLTTADAAKLASTFQEIDIVAKDSRGTGWAL
jgi:hypothetical protein